MRPSDRSRVLLLLDREALLLQPAEVHLTLSELIGVLLLGDREVEGDQLLRLRRDE